MQGIVITRYRKLDSLGQVRQVNYMFEVSLLSLKVIVSKTPERGGDEQFDEQKHIELSICFIYLAKLYLCFRPKSKWLI